MFKFILKNHKSKDSPYSDVPRYLEHEGNRKAVIVLQGSVPAFRDLNYLGEQM
jgi:hypothetical protein